MCTVLYWEDGAYQWARRYRPVTCIKATRPVTLCWPETEFRAWDDEEYIGTKLLLPTTLGDTTHNQSYINNVSLFGFPKEVHLGRWK